MALLWQGTRAASHLTTKYVASVMIKVFTLPGCYRVLGEGIYKDAKFREDFPSHFGAIDELLAQVAAIQAKAGSAAKAAGFADQTRAAAVFVGEALAKKALAVWAQSHLTYIQLGRAVYEKHGEESGDTTELVTPIANAQSRLVSLDFEIRQLSDSPPGQALTPKRIAIGEIAGIAVFLVVVVALLSNRGSDKLSAKERDAAKAVLKQFKKPESYTEAGLTYTEYQRRVLDAKGEVDSQLHEIPAGAVKNALKRVAPRLRRCK